MRAACYFDYTCGYSFRAWRWIEEQVRAARGELNIEWSVFSLKELNRPDPTSVFENWSDPGISVLALAASVATRGADFTTFHAGAFRAFHVQERRADRDDLLQLVGSAGVDAASFWAERRRWIAAVAEEHHAAVDRWGVFGTPTLVLQEAAVYLKMTEVPTSGDEGVRLWDALETLAVSHPELLEIKRPQPAIGRKT